MASILGSSGTDFLTGGALNDTINGLAGADIMAGGLGDDVYYVDNLGDAVTEAGAAGTDTIISTIALSSGFANVENYDFSKVVGPVNFTGNSLNNVIIGTAKVDTLAGGTGHDTYYLNSANDVVLENAASGSDTIAVTFSADLANYANVEHIHLLGTGALNATGNSVSNTLTGNDGANILDGKGGVDSMAGGKGNDTYFADNFFDGVIEKANEGVDTVISTTNYALSSNVENLTLAAGAGDIIGWGNELKNILIGNEGKNELDGGAGADTMKGGAGDDIYYVDNIGDKVVEYAGEGADVVYSSIDFSLAALANVEHVALTGSAIKATGNAQGNTINGNSQNNIIDGGAGADKMAGGLGDDTYYVDNLADTVAESSGQGTDTIVSSIALATAFGDVENYDFSKLAVAINFTGNDLANVIKGGTGIDKLAGGKGDDTYYFNSVQDVVIENTGEGTDTIVTTFSADLANYGAYIENIRLAGTTALNATGNAVSNTLTGNDGANILDGKGGTDTMQGGKGNDTYFVDNPGDKVVEKDNEGIDTVFAGVNYTLADNIENLTIQSGVMAGTGNDLNNIIIGNALDNALDGMAGADTLKGGAGNDAYYVDNAGDKITELAGEGTHDKVIATTDFSLATLLNVEDLYLAGMVVKATGNALNNMIFGNANNNIIDGGLGADTMTGGDGHDIFYVDNVGDVAVENSSQGIDKVISTIALSHGFANVEDYDFSKAASVVNFTGTDDNNQIWSSAFNDTFAGGKGSDYYHLNNAGDSIVEASGEGNDVAYVNFSVANIWDNVEGLYLLGTANLNATADASGNFIHGNEGINALTGNSGKDILSGNGGNDILVGNGGDDYLAGGDGNDILTGGAGADTFGFVGGTSGSALLANDIITDFDGTMDKLDFSMSGDGDGDGNWGEFEDIAAGVVDYGAGKDIVLYLMNGGTVTFTGIGTGAIDSLSDLVSDPMTQITHT